MELQHPGFEIGEVIITDVRGKIIFQTSTTEATLTWYTDDVDNGLYLISAKVDSEQLGVEKIIIQH
ncbi:T9SS type A sorting domain-containing protein [Crocinitomix catalasitica]|nr:T9SS type A sorting domain-containing protein [Crocinitomix catalasitica]